MHSMLVFKASEKWTKLVSILYCLSLLTLAATTSLPNVTYSGYLPVGHSDGSKLFYTYYEAEGVGLSKAPVLLWLQGGPGCASQFGSFYELGPQAVNSSLLLQSNKGAWNNKAGLLFIDQPIGTGFSPTGSRRIPTDEVEIATDVYVALQHFFEKYSHLQNRPFVITGESYAGKYVPSLGHYILQMERIFGKRALSEAFPLDMSRLPENPFVWGPPKFKLSGLAIGNGFTDPYSQMQSHADTAFFNGLINEQQRVEVLGMQLQVAQAIAQENWVQADDLRTELLDFVKNLVGAATLLDYRRVYDYDSEKLVDKFLNQADVKKHLGAEVNITYESCSSEIGKILGADAMKSVKHVIPDLLESYPFLLYHGVYDIQDGPASQEAWIHGLEWYGRHGFVNSRRKIWRAHPDGSIPHFQGQLPDGERQLGRVVGYWREWETLTQVVLRGAGHMVPHDDSLAAQAMIETWLERSGITSLENDSVILH